MTHVVHHGDCREVMATLDAESVDAVVCDPPYGLSFMGKGWDHGVPGVEFWVEALRVAKPGAHLLAFGGTRTFHRLACAIEDAGWEIRDCVMWVYGSGFPKSHDVSKAIDKAAGAEREVVGTIPDRWTGKSSVLNFATDRPQSEVCVTGSPATDAARQWSGWGTALKPAWEPIIVARKPLCGTVAENVLKHGTGGINVDGCRVAGSPRTTHADGSRTTGKAGYCGGWGATECVVPPGRWPANVIHDGSDEVVELFPETRPGAMPARRNSEPGSGRTLGGGWNAPDSGVRVVLDSGSAARFFYCAKASKADREEGCEGLIVKDVHRYGAGLGECIDPNAPVRNRNHHPTVKPAALMRYLCRLVTPPGGIVLDPFTGSGSTGKAAVMEGFDFVGIEREAEYVEIARARIAAAVPEMEPAA